MKNWFCNEALHRADWCLDMVVSPIAGSLLGSALQQGKTESDVLAAVDRAWFNRMSRVKTIDSGPDRETARAGIHFQVQRGSNRVRFLGHATIRSQSVPAPTGR